MNKIAEQVNMMSANNYPWYNYNVKKKKVLKGLIINSTNDLFTPTGLLSEICANFKDMASHPLQANNDMDFTGALEIGIVTDYLKINRSREIKSYQTLAFGFEVYTPFYRIDSIFNNDTSFNVNDRPHASFRYFSLETNGVSYGHGFRWNMQLKVGKIGGEIGNMFQTVLHQDVSSSPRPVGWGAQIANRGRLGFSLEYRPEWLLPIEKLFRGVSYLKKEKINNRFKGFYSSVTGDFAFGSYMTYAGLGFQLSNKNFRSSNQDYMTIRNTSKKYKWGNLMINFYARLRYVVHNTMLEGFGYVNTIEANDDAQTPRSIYTIGGANNNNEVNRWMQFYDLTFSTQKKHFTLFYKLSTKSPEVQYESDFEGIDDRFNLNERWHHYSTIGICFKI